MEQASQLQAWIDAARHGDQTAITKLLAVYHPQLHARAEARMDGAMRSRFEPEDVLQHVYLQVFRQMERFQGADPDSFLNWALTILDHKLIDAWRACHRQARDVARECNAMQAGCADSYWNLLDQVCTELHTPSRIMRKDEAVDAMAACVAKLPDAYRQVIQLRFLEGQSVADVATRLNTTEAAVLATTRRALNELRLSMDRLGEFTQGG
ncbi:MAG: sigma-70 family RNA polymerase sigma factor [Phycisphaerae bacterium]|nr:sigma-70 family RNA polymerase sigma factor [Phycisphaerae bacterium]